MRNLLSLLGAALLAVPVSGQDLLRIHQKDGQYVDFLFEDEPAVYYRENYLVINTAITEVQYPFESVAKFTFTDVATKTEVIKEDLQTPAFTLDNYAISITGAKAQVKVTVISSDGKPVETYKTDADGNAFFSISALPAGMYIINSENLTFKVLKK